MRIIPDECPSCAGEPYCVLESALAHTFFEKKEDGTYDWSTSRGTEVFWDSTEPIMDEKDKVSVRCSECEQWYDAEIKPDEEEENEREGSEADEGL